MPYLIPYEVKSSSICSDGLGIFSKVDIKKDQIVSVVAPYERLVLDIEYIETIEKAHDHKERLIDLLNNGWYTTEFGATGKYIYVLNDDKYINHSCDPNLEERTQNKRCFQIALKDIKAGEELTNNYATYECPNMYFRGLYEKYNVWHYVPEHQSDSF